VIEYFLKKEDLNYILEPELSIGFSILHYACVYHNYEVIAVINYITFFFAWLKLSF